MLRVAPMECSSKEKSLNNGDHKEKEHSEELELQYLWHRVEQRCECDLQVLVLCNDSHWPQDSDKTSQPNCGQGPQSAHREDQIHNRSEQDKEIQNVPRILKVAVLPIPNEPKCNDLNDGFN